MNATPSNGWAVPYQFPDSTYSTYSTHASTTPFATVQVNGLITPLTQPSSSEAWYNETFTSLGEPRLQVSDYTYPTSEQAGYNMNWSSSQSHGERYVGQQTSWLRESYLSNQQTPFTYPTNSNLHMDTAPPSPEFLPGSYNPTSSAELFQSPREDEVLIGMGLYDGPTKQDSASLGCSQPISRQEVPAGKGLKLEETFEPTASEETDDDNEDSDDDADGDDGGESVSSIVIEPQVPDCTTDTAGLVAGFVPPRESVDCLQSIHTESLSDQYSFDGHHYGDFLLPPNYEHLFNGPMWTNVYTGMFFQAN
jgi:hypothetical protein